MGKKMNSDEFDPPLTLDQISWVSSLLNLGAAVGPLIFGNLSDRIGRKYTILGTGIPLLLGFLMMAFSRSVAVYYVARFLSGLSVGGVFNVIPVYISEIASQHNRGALSALLNLLLCAGMLFTYCLGPYVNVTTFNIILVFFPALFLVSFFLIGPESAYFYIQNEKYHLAKDCLQKVRPASVKVEEELNLIRTKIQEDGQGSFFDIFKTKELKKAFGITIGLMVFQQFTGIIAVLYYAEKIFKNAGVDLDPAICTIIIGLVQFLTAFVTPLVIDRLGRKMLLIISSVGMVISEAPLGTYSFFKDKGHDVSSIAMLPVICLIVYIITYNFGYGPLPWTIMGELFPTNVKSAASVFLTFFCWSLAFLVARFFEPVALAIGNGTAYWIFSVSCGISIAFDYFIVIETKGKSLHEIQEELKK